MCKAPFSKLRKTETYEAVQAELAQAGTSNGGGVKITGVNSNSVLVNPKQVINC